MSNGGIQQRLAIAEKLLITMHRRFFPAFVFPRETILLPNIGKTALAFALRFLGNSSRIFEREKFRVFDDTFLKTKRFAAGRISSRWRWVI